VNGRAEKYAFASVGLWSSYPSPASRNTKVRLSDADQAELSGHWPKGDAIEVETATSTEFNCFLANGDDGDCRFAFWKGATQRVDSMRRRPARLPTTRSAGVTSCC
jgi:hypothetical protein